MASGARRACCGIELTAPAMIGVIADSTEHDVVPQSFELFKTHRGFYRQGGHYDALFCSGMSSSTGLQDSSSDTTSIVKFEFIDASRAIFRRSTPRVFLQVNPTRPTASGSIPCHLS